jgi:putative transcriptional regulator
MRHHKLFEFIWLPTFERTSKAILDERLAEMAKSNTKVGVGPLILQGTHEARDHKRGRRAGARITRSKVTVRGVEVVAPPRYRDVDIRRVRQRLSLSQAVFAKLIGASVSTVRAWERGAREPSDMARRLIELADREPGVFEPDLVPSG